MNADGSDQGRLTERAGDTSTPAGVVPDRPGVVAGRDGDRVRERPRGVVRHLRDGRRRPGTRRLTTTTANDRADMVARRLADRLPERRGRRPHLRDARGRDRRAQARRATSAPEIEPAWSPDGRWIAYSRRASRQRDPRDLAGAPRRLGAAAADEPGRGAYAPAWSPDGKALAFAARQRTGHFEIYTIGVDGKGLRRVTYSTEDAFEPAWSPDGVDDRVLARRRDRRRSTRTASSSRSSPMRKTTTRARTGTPVPPKERSRADGDRRARRHARHEGQGVRVPRAIGSGSTVSTSCSSTPGSSASRSSTPDVTRDEVAAAAGADAAALAAAGDRGAAIETMARGAAEIVERLHAEGRLDAIGGLGGSGGSALVTHAMRELPIGVPKLMVSTVASGDTSPYVGSVDVTMMYSVVDIAGVNQISARIMSNAAGALAGMAQATVPPTRRGAPRSWWPRCSASRRRASRRHASGSRSSGTRCSSSTRPERAAARWRSCSRRASPSARST